jgi:hypothetical protein
MIANPGFVHEMHTHEFRILSSTHVARIQATIRVFRRARFAAARTQMRALGCHFCLRICQEAWHSFPVTDALPTLWGPAVALHADIVDRRGD